MSNQLSHSLEGKLTTREMQLVDLDAVVENETRAYAFPWSRGIFADCLKSGYLCRVLLYQGNVIGHLILNTVVDEAHLLNVCVRRERQGAGLGRLLVRHAIDLCRDAGATQMFLEVRPSNRKAISLYNSLGFTQIGLRPEYYPGDPVREDAVVMMLPLDEPVLLELPSQTELNRH